MDTLQTLAWHRSVEACAPDLPEPTESALLGRLCADQRISIDEARQRVHREARSIDHQFEYEAGLL